MGTNFSKYNFLKISKEALEFQLKALYPIQIQDDPVRISFVFLNHDRNFSSFLSVRHLVEHGRVADVNTLSRSMFESVISMALLAKTLIKNDLDRYQDYQFVEIWKTHNHLQRIGLERLSGVPPLQVEFVRNKRDEYIRKYGRRLPTWTGMSFEQNVKAVDANYAPTCNERRFYEYLYCQVYRRGSQSTHSSFAGLSKGVEIERMSLPGELTAQMFRANENHLIFSSFHSLLVFLSSVRFIGHLLDKKNTEVYFQAD